VINRIPKCTPFWLEMLQIASVSGAPPQTPLGELTTLPQTPYSREGLLAFGNRSFAPSALNPPFSPPNKNIHPVSPQIQNPRTATARALAIAMRANILVRQAYKWNATDGAIQIVVFTLYYITLNYNHRMND